MLKPWPPPGYAPVGHNLSLGKMSHDSKNESKIKVLPAAIFFLSQNILLYTAWNQNARNMVANLLKILKSGMKWQRFRPWNQFSCILVGRCDCFTWFLAFYLQTFQSK